LGNREYSHGNEVCPQGNPSPSGEAERELASQSRRRDGEGGSRRLANLEKGRIRLGGALTFAMCCPQSAKLFFLRARSPCASRKLRVAQAHWPQVCEAEPAGCLAPGQRSASKGWHMRHTAKSGRRSGCMARAWNTASALECPDFSGRPVSTRNSFPSRSCRKGLEHWELAQWLSIPPSPIVGVRRQAVGLPS